MITGITLVKSEVSVSDFFFERIFLTSNTGILLKNFLRETLVAYSNNRLSKNQDRKILVGLMCELVFGDPSLEADLAKILGIRVRQVLG